MENECLNTVFLPYSMICVMLSLAQPTSHSEISAEFSLRWKRNHFVAYFILFHIFHAWCLLPTCLLHKGNQGPSSCFQLSSWIPCVTFITQNKLKLQPLSPEKFAQVERAIILAHFKLPLTSNNINPSFNNACVHCWFIMTYYEV